MPSENDSIFRPILRLQNDSFAIAKDTFGRTKSETARAVSGPEASLPPGRCTPDIPSSHHPMLRTEYPESSQTTASLVSAVGSFVLRISTWSEKMALTMGMDNKKDLGTVSVPVLTCQNKLFWRKNIIIPNLCSWKPFEKRLLYKRPHSTTQCLLHLSGSKTCTMRCSTAWWFV